MVATGHAASLYWDGTSTGPDADGGAGTWSTAASPANWDTAATAGADVAWTAGSDAVFNGPGGGVTVSGTVSATSLTFGSSSYVLSDGQLTLTGTPVIHTGSNNAAVYTYIASSVPILKTGTGTLTLGSNGFSHTFTVAEGTVKAYSSNVFGSTGQGTTISSGATFDVNGYFSGERFTISGSGVGNAGAILNTNPATSISSFIGVQYVTLAGPARVGGTGNWEATNGGSITMAGHTLTKVGTNDVEVGSTIFTPGNIDIEEGSLTFKEAASVNGSAANAITVRSGATLGMRRALSGPYLWTAIFEAGSKFRSAGTNNWSNTWFGPVTLNGATTFESLASVTLNVTGVISGPGSMTKTGEGGCKLTAANTYAGGTTVSEGKLILDPDFTSGVGVLRGAVTVGVGGFLTLAKENALGTTAGMRVNPLNVSGYVESTGTGSNSLGIVNLTGGRLRSNGNVNSANAASYYTLEHDGVVNGQPAAWPSTISGRLHLGAGNTGNTSVFQIADGGAVEDLRIESAITASSAANGLTKRGAGALALHGPALYAGSTVVEEGTLLLEGIGTLPDSPVIVNAGARAGTTTAGRSFASITAQASSSLILPALDEGGTVVKGTLDLAGGTISICPVIGDVVAPGTYDLLVADQITGSGTPVVNFSSVLGTTGVTGSVVVTGNKLQLIVTGTGKDLVWNNATAGGAASGTWDSSLANFSNGTGNDVFRAYDSVTFDDSVAPGAQRVVLPGGILAPARLTVNNSNGDYWFPVTLTGRIAGVGALVKTGSGRLSMDWSYAMTGPITAAGGTLSFNGSVATSKLTLAAGSLETTSPTLAITTGPMDLQAGSASAVLQGGAPWTKSTAGTVTLTADNKLTGAGTIAAGQLVVGNSTTPSLIGSLGTAPVSIASGASVVIHRGNSTTKSSIPNAFSGSGSLTLAGNHVAGTGFSDFRLTGDLSALTGSLNITNARVATGEGKGMSSGPITLSGQAGIIIDSVTLPNPLTLATTNYWGSQGTFGNLFLRNASLTGSITLPGSVTTVVTSEYPGPSQSTISGSIGQSGGAAALKLAAAASTKAGYTLSGASTYTGATTVEKDATLNLTGSLGATAVTVKGYGTLTGNGTIGTGGSLTLSPFYSRLRASSSGDCLTVNGNVSIGANSEIELELTGGLAPDGPIPVLHYTGTITGEAYQMNVVNYSSYRQAGVAFASGFITLDIGAKALVWKGADGSIWENGGSTMRWGTTNAGDATDFFYRGDSVEFNDSGAGGLVSGGVSAMQPSSIVVDNSAKNYTLGVAIEGSGLLVKSGTGKLTMPASNSYTGGTTVHAGRLEVSGLKSLGSGPVSIGAAAILSGDATISGAVSIAGTLDPGVSPVGSPVLFTTGPAVVTGNYRCSLYSSSSDHFFVVGDLNLTGSALTLVPDSPVLNSMPQTWTIASYTGTLSGAFASVSGLPAGYGVKYDTAGKQIVVTRMNYTDWLASHSGLSDTTDGGDPDGDGLPNPVEYVVGGDPAVGDASAVPTQTIEGDKLVFRYKRNDGSISTTEQTVQWSTDMVNWTDIPIPQTSLLPVAITPNGDQPDDVKVSITRVAGSMYVRLKVMQR
jgi:fibronectin-binding autotransporter adhesin